jgi:glutamyl-tRNA(Gln) amidotransferase subunit E
VAGVGGIVHSDELPGYGITGEEVAQISRALGCGEKDAFVLVADREARVRAALERVVARAGQALEGVPEETRDPRPDGSTVYSRPLPGRARMYPETDIAPVRVTAERLGVLGKQLPEMPEVRIARLTKEYGLHPQEAHQIVDGGEEALFTALAGISGDPKAAVRTLHNTLPELRAEGLEVESLGEEKLFEVHRRFGQGQFPREAIPNILRSLLLEGGSVDEAVASLGLARASRAEVERVVEEVLRERATLVESRGEAAVGPLMGLAMERLRGRAEGKVVSEVLKQKIRARRPHS